jgi:hypothetical protein
MTLIGTHSQNIDSGIFQQPLIRSCCNFAQSYKAQKEEDLGGGGGGIGGTQN